MVPLPLFSIRGENPSKTVEIVVIRIIVQPDPRVPRPRPVPLPVKEEMQLVPLYRIPAAVLGPRRPDHAHGRTLLLQT